ncbi:SAM-dependent methyltransferase [Orientia tsutsugamushi str. Gilliam]|uniref:SAM-dependent methyltransferase n=1 Tax=Orientia tsutsugamushi str. Gilliam TaxID=1359184 RepID=A0A2U3QMN1_ORITS|nr:methyltransferase domain-containing protein [Orientia tsutsugamushi]SPR02204.1 SAM-dependent methyltransferase [Orientia tsutsugamushi str. Gilliam]
MNYIFNREAYRMQRNIKVANEIHSCSFLLDFCVDDIVCRLSQINQQFSNILDLGARNGILTSKLKKLYNKSNIVALEIAENLINQIHDNDVMKVIADDANIPFLSESFDLVASLLNMHWLNDFPIFLKQVLQVLTDNGAFIGCLLGENTLSVLRKKLIEAESILQLPHTPHISPFIRVEDAVKLFQLAGLNVIVDIETIEVEYKSCLDLMKELGNMGEAAKFHQRQLGLHKKLLHFLMNEQSPINEKFDIIAFIAFKNPESLSIKDL